MKKLLSTLFLLLIISSYSFAQKISQNDMIPMFQHWSKKNWDSVYIVSKEILRKCPNDTTAFKSNMNYAFVYSAAAKTAEHKMTYPELREALKSFLGKPFLTPVHATTTDKKLNQSGVTLITRDKSGSRATTISRTDDQKTIICIEEFNFKKKIKPTQDFKNRFIRCGGKLYSIEINSKMDDVWIIHLVFYDAYYL